jgi:tripartite-type tricarboxylate transporter receptor subunit TctC
MNAIGPFALFAALAFTGAPAVAQSYPVKPIRIIVPFAAGGLPDTIARVVGKHTGDSLGQPMVVENRPGAASIAATEVVARAQPDGYTLLMTDAGQVAINPHLYPKLPYDPLKDLVPVSLLATSSLFITVNAAFPANSFTEFLAYVRANPGKINYGSAGIGSVLHLGLAAITSEYGLDMVHVPYKGTGEAIPALLTGQIDVLYSALPSMVQHIKAGKVKILAASSVRRSPQAPNVPTVAEMGFAGYDFGPEMGITAPARTPESIVAKLAGELSRSLKNPEVAQRFADLGINPVGSSPSAYAEAIKVSYERYGRVVKTSGARLD